MRRVPPVVGKPHLRVEAGLWRVCWRKEWEMDREWFRRSVLAGMWLQRRGRDFGG